MEKFISYVQQRNVQPHTDFFARLWGDLYISTQTMWKCTNLPMKHGRKSTNPRKTLKLDDIPTYVESHLAPLF